MKEKRIEQNRLIQTTQYMPKKRIKIFSKPYMVHLVRA